LARWPAVSEGQISYIVIILTLVLFPYLHVHHHV